MEKNAFNELIAALKEQAENYNRYTGERRYPDNQEQAEAQTRIFKDTAKVLNDFITILQDSTDIAHDISILISERAYNMAEGDAMIYNRHPSQIK